MKQIFQTDTEFFNLTVPLSKEEEENLESKIVKEGCKEPIIVWHGIILDGYKRYKLCTYEEIEYEVREMDFLTRKEAIVWVCKQRISSVKKYSARYRYIIGKLYSAQKIVNRLLKNSNNCDNQHRKKPQNESVSIWDTSAILSDELNVGHTLLQKSSRYAEAMDIIFEKEPELFYAIIREDIKYSHREILELSVLDKDELEKIKKNKMTSNDVKMRKRGKTQKEIREDAHKENEKPLITGIKEMPKYDPDMELKGLELTIPTWINVIAKTENKIDIVMATENAKERLTANLIRLQEQIQHTLEVLK